MDLQLDKLREYGGLELIDPHPSNRGAKWYEADVGKARPTDLKGTRGGRRIVLLKQSGRIEKILFTDDHYKPGSWLRVIDA